MTLQELEDFFKMSGSAVDFYADLFWTNFSQNEF